ncbi:AMP-binding protein, partial [Luteibacter sp. ME-Dv--P-043b]|uniref:non-ribosomal peptide synthetase n=1 Tax=Luteibacter sp. ME-Dv--P-043b TaxID=3040291 RepID=UPI00255555D4
MLVLRTDTSGNPRFRDLVRRARQVDLDAFQHQDLPFERLVDLTHPERVTGRHPLFQVAFIMNNHAQAALNFADVIVTDHSIDTVQAKYDLAFSFAESRDEAGQPIALQLGIEYATDLFDEATVARMVQRLSRLLEEVAIEPDRRLDRIDLLEAHERRTLLLDWNDTATDLAATTVTAAFERQARRVPDAVALVCGDRQLTYAQLEDRANRLARMIISEGVGNDVLVGVALPRSPELVIAQLAVLKTGAAFLPIDAEYPKERLTFIFNDAQPRCVLLAHDLPIELPSSVSRITVNDETLSENPRILPLPGERSFNDIRVRDVQVHPDHLAYVIYTSGSTGIPKGVAATHGNVVGLAADALLCGDQHERVLMHSPQVFDAVTYEIWAPLLAGHCVVIAPPGRFDVEGLGALIRQHAVTAVFLTTALFRVIAAEAPAHLAPLRTIWTGGEQAVAEAFRQIRAHAPDLEIVHVYGPTETTTFATTHTLGALAPLTTQVPIGRPMDNTQAYVLDAFLQPVPVGVPGELYIGGT